MKAHIKIVDDDADVASNMAAALRHAGWDVSVRHVLDGALEELLRDRPDLLILDVMFPEDPAGGFGLARKVRLRREIRNMPIILLSAVNTEFPADIGEEDVGTGWLPVQCFMEKPPDLSALIEKVRELLAR